MPRNLDILDRDEWFLQEEKRKEGDAGYPIYYRYAITYSIAKKILKNQKDKTWIKQELEKLIHSLNAEEAYHNQEFIELFPLAESKSYVLVDQTDSYYPLMFYSSEYARNGKPRVSALKHSLKDISDGLEEIYESLAQLKSLNDWTPGFQESLYCLYPTNKKSKLKCTA